MNAILNRKHSVSGGIFTTLTQIMATPSDGSVPRRISAKADQITS